MTTRLSPLNSAAPEPRIQTATRFEPVYESDNMYMAERIADLGAGQATLKKFLTQGSGAFISAAEHESQDEQAI